MKPELLSPAGSFPSLQAAVDAGADAIYLAGRRFGARKYAPNFTDDELREAIRFSHASGAKVYVTVNTLIYDNEMADALGFLADLYSWGADAAIVQDLGLISLAHGQVPLELHGSTQMSVHDAAGALFAKELGLRRAILARELALSDVRAIAAEFPSEVFIHGALCYCHSGQCLMSSFIGGRSGNRGSCAQPCRREYALDGLDAKPLGPYLLSSRELNTLAHVPEIAKSGVVGLKIEGRMRSPEYVALATAAYRHVIDTGEMPDSGVLKMLELAFNRDYTKGYMMGARHGEVMGHASQGSRGLQAGKVVSIDGRWITVKTEGASIVGGDGIRIGADGGLVHAAREEGAGIQRVKADVPAKPGDDVFITSSPRLEDAARRAMKGGRRPTRLSVRIAAGQALRMTAKCKGWSFTAEGPVVQRAEKRPVAERDVREAVGVLGDTFFELEKLDVELGKDCFLPISAVKSTRRALLAGLLEELAKSTRRERPKVTVTNPEKKPKQQPVKIIVRVRHQEAAQLALASGADIVLVDASFGLDEALAIADERAVVELPRITTNAFFAKHGQALRGTGKTMLAHSMGAKKHVGEKAAYGGFSLNLANSWSAALAAKHFTAFEASPEVDLEGLKAMAQIADVWTTVQGRQELMVTEDCIPKSAGACDDCQSGILELVDGTGARFPFLRDSACRTHIYNSAETCMVDKLADVVAAGVSGIVIDLRLKNDDDAAAIAKSYRTVLDCATSGKAVSDEVVQTVKSLSSPKLTHGHFIDKAE